MDVIFTIVSRNYAAQAATLMESLAVAEPKARRVVVATDGPIPHLERLAEVIDAREFCPVYNAMSVYYDALELNTAVKPYVFRRFLSETGATSATYLDPDIFVFRPLDAVRDGLAQAQLALTPHLTRPLLGSAMPNDHAILQSGSYNLGFCSARAEPKTVDLMAWWADRCEFDCRVDLKTGLFTDQRWMDLSPGFVDSLAVLRTPTLNLAYWNLEGRALARTKGGWTVDGEPLAFFHFSGFDPSRPDVLSKHQDRVKVTPGSLLAELLADYAAAMLRNGHETSRAVPYAHLKFPSGRPITAAMRRRALRAARDGKDFSQGLTAAVEAWVDAPDPEAALAGLPDITRTMDQVWRDIPTGFQLDHEQGRLGFHAFFAEHAQTLSADAISGSAAQALLTAWRSGTREPDASVWGEAPWRGPASGVFDWLREPAADAIPRAAKALLAARGDLRAKFADDAPGLIAWCLGAEAAAGRFAPDLLPTSVIEALARDPAPLLSAARLAEPGAGDLKRRLSAGFGVAARAGWPKSLTQAVRAPFLEAATAQPAPFIRLFLEIREARVDLQRLFPLRSGPERFKYLRWLVGGGLAEYGVEFDALPAAVRLHPQMQLARMTVRQRQPAARAAAGARVAELWVVEGAELAKEAAADRLVYEAQGGRFFGPSGPAAAPAQADLVRFLTHPDLVPADAVALHSRGVRWSRAVGVWDAATAAALTENTVGLGFVDEVWASGAGADLFRPVKAA
ncbi:MAG TPA: hypothetical protein VFE18_18065 [Phenylobacterium sp.]|uniref:hypothetical protein n=1 Tax=Phenylobacterium sp. TaxID=1871053 RepID=UPI002D2C83D5|nr:hypothetical protein [Phenylobacterium sp.]HZZ70082.1 hypothetical protein [Phenylobacterium sp.]